MWLIPIAVLIIFLLILIWLIYQLVWGTPPWINLAVERWALKLYLSDPEGLTKMGLLENTLLDFHSDKLTDVSPRYMARLCHLDRQGYLTLRRYLSKRLTGQARITYELMRGYFAHQLSGHRFVYHWYANAVFMGPYPVNHVFGVQIDLINFLTTYHRISNRRSIRRYLKRLHYVNRKLSGLEETLRGMEEMGAIPPRFVLEKTLQQIDDFLEKPIAENPLYSSFVEELSQSDRLREGFKNRWAGSVYAAIEEEVLPAYRRLQGFLQGWLQKASDEDGVWRLPNGEEYYAFLLRGHTTTDLTPMEVHQLGLDAVEQITKSAQGVLERMGVPTDDPGAQMQALMQDPQHHFHGDNCREAITRAYQEILDEVNQKMPEIFNYGAMDTILVKRLPEFREPDSPIAYAEEPSLDGSRPGTMWLNLRDPDNIYRWGMRTLAYHEGIPGHVYQMAQAQKLRGLPSFRRHFFYNAYVEGWALYAERLGWELGLEDDLDNLGRLQALLWRAARLVVDTGIHVMRWTRQEAIDYMIAKTGLPERDVITEVERYIVMPGQACAYYIGYQKLSLLRQKAESILGDAFHLKDFHDVIINNGSLPLLLLEEVVNDYIDRVSGLMTGQAE